MTQQSADASADAPASDISDAPAADTANAQAALPVNRMEDVVRALEDLLTSAANTSDESSRATLYDKGVRRLLDACQRACAAAADTDGRSSAADSDEVTELRKQLSLAKVALAEASFDAEETARKERRASRDAADKERKLNAQEEERRKRLEQARLGAFGGRR